jgi:hypothetical protein
MKRSEFIFWNALILGGTLAFWVVPGPDGAWEAGVRMLSERQDAQYHEERTRHNEAILAEYRAVQERTK